MKIKPQTLTEVFIWSVFKFHEQLTSIPLMLPESIGKNNFLWCLVLVVSIDIADYVT